MAAGKNIRSRKKIQEALKQIHSPFTSGEMAHITGLTAKRVQGLLRGLEGVEKEYVNRSRGGISGTPSGRIRCRWRVIDVD